MDDASAVLALRSGDLTAFGRIYDAYSSRLLAYATTLLGDPDAASDAVHDAFLLAHDRIDQLRDPTLLRPWLYAITRRQAQRTLRTRGRTAPIEAAVDVSADENRWDQRLDADDARLLVLAALAGLSASDREVIELALRHELDNAAAARTLGRSSSHASALVSRAKQQFDVALSAVLLMRTRGRDCADLQHLVGEATTITPLLRKRIARHAKSCDSCAGNRRAAIAVLPGVALALPFQAASEALRSSLLDDSGRQREGVTPRDSAATQVRFDREGFPTDTSTSRHRWIVAAAIAGVLALAIAGGTGNSAAPAALSAAVDDAQPVATAGSRPTPAGTTVPKPTPTQTASGRAPVALPPTTNPSDTPPSQRATPRAQARDSGIAESSSGGAAPASPPSAKAPVIPPAPPSTPAVSAQWTLLDSSACGRTLDIGVIASASGAEVTRATALWNTSSASGSMTLTRASDSSWQGTLLDIPGRGNAQLTVRIVTAQGASATSDAQSISLPCGD